MPFLVEIPLKVVIVELIAVLILAVPLTLLLDRIVGQMYELVLGVVGVVVVATGPDVPLLVPVPLYSAVLTQLTLTSLLRSM